MRVSLRRLRREDGEDVLRWRNDPLVRAQMYTDHVIPPEEHAAWLDAALNDPSRAFWIIEADGRGGGTAQLRRLDAHGRYDWAFHLGEADLRGRGVGAAVEFLVVEHAFLRSGARKLWCEVLAENEGVWRMHESFGFRIEARLRGHVVTAGRPRDVVGLGLLREDWMELRAASRERLSRRVELDDSSMA